MKPKNSKSVIVKDAVTIIACNVFTGLLISSVNVTESGLTQGITDELMMRFIVTYGLIFLLRYFLRCSEKELRNEVINEGHISHYEKSLNSCQKQVNIDYIMGGVIYPILFICISKEQYMVYNIKRYNKKWYVDEHKIETAYNTDDIKYIKAESDDLLIIKKYNTDAIVIGISTSGRVSYHKKINGLKLNKKTKYVKVPINIILKISDEINISNVKVYVKGCEN